MFVLAHLSDPHLGPLPPVALRDLMSKRALGYINWQRSRKHHHQPGVLGAVLDHMRLAGADHIAVTGDLVNIALEGEFHNALDWLRAVGDAEAVSLVPGNHDAYIRLDPDASIGLWRDYMASDPALLNGAGMFPFLRRRQGISLIGLSTAIPAPWFKAVGALGGEQIEAFQRLSVQERDEGQCRVVMMHHPPHRLGTPLRKRLMDCADFLDALKAVGADLVLFGHNHRFDLTWLQGPDRMIPAVGVPSASAAVTDTGGEGGYHVFEIRAGAHHARIDLKRFGASQDGKVSQIGDIIPLNGEDQDTVSALLQATAPEAGK